MNRQQVAEAADALARLEALYEAYDDAKAAPYRALPISFYSDGGESGRRSYDGTKAFYPRKRLIETLFNLIRVEENLLFGLGVEPKHHMSVLAAGEPGDPFDVRSISAESIAETVDADFEPVSVKYDGTEAYDPDNYPA